MRAPRRTLAGQVVLVSGGGQRYGQLLVAAFAQAGAHLALTAPTLAEAEALYPLLEGIPGVELLAEGHAPEDAAALSLFLDHVAQRFASPTHWIHLPPVAPPIPPMGPDPEAWLGAVRGGVASTLVAARAAARTPTCRRFIAVLPRAAPDEPRFSAQEAAMAGAWQVVAAHAAGAVPDQSFLALEIPLSAEMATVPAPPLPSAGAEALLGLGRELVRLAGSAGAGLSGRRVRAGESSGRLRRLLRG